MGKWKLGLVVAVAAFSLRGPGCSAEPLQRGGWDRNGTALGNQTVELQGAHVAGGTLVR